MPNNEAAAIAACCCCIIFVLLLWMIEPIILGVRSAMEYDYDVSVKYTCLEFDGTNGLCAKWQQKAEIKVPYGGCFPGDVMLMGEAGPVAMQDLSIGDRILGLDVVTGVPQYSSVRGWLHREPSQVMNMVEIWTQGGGKLVVSPGHMLAVASQARATDEDHHVSSSSPHSAATYVRASHLRPGDILVSPPTGASMNSTLVTVEGTRIGHQEGLYAPLTWQSNYYVAVEPRGNIGDKSFADRSASMFTRLDDTAQSLRSMVLAHSFANIDEPQRYEAAWHRLLTIADLVLPSALVSREDGTTAMPESYVHPLARLMMRLLGAAPMEPVIFEAELDVVDNVAIGGRHLQSAAGYAALSLVDPAHHGLVAFQDRTLFFLSILQLAILPPWMANRAVAPNPPLSDFTREPSDDDDDDGVPLSTTEQWLILAYFLGFGALVCALIVCCACVQTLAEQKNRQREQEAQEAQEMLYKGDQRDTNDGTSDDPQPPQSSGPSSSGYYAQPAHISGPQYGYPQTAPVYGPYGYPAPGAGVTYTQAPNYYY